MKRKNNQIGFRIGLVLTGIMLLLVLTGIVYTPYDPNGMDGAAKLMAPGPAHLMGTDNFGRDILSRVMEGLGTTVLIALVSVGIGAAAGIVLGGLTGYFGGWIDEILMRINDTIAAFPNLLVALVVISILGPGKYNIIAALGILFVPSFTRMVRSEYLRCRETDYVKSARLIGAGHMRIIFVHIFPNILPVFLSSVLIGFNNAILAEASMSYLGIGVQPPDASLGRMLSEAQTYLFKAPWYALFPGLVIILLMLGLSLLADGIKTGKRGGRDV